MNADSDTSTGSSPPTAPESGGRWIRDLGVVLIALFAVALEVAAIPAVLFQPLLGLAFASIGLILTATFFELNDQLNGGGVHRSPLLERLYVFLVVPLFIPMVPAIFVVVYVIRGMFS